MSVFIVHKAFFMRKIFAFTLLSFLLPALAIGSLLNERTYKRLGQVHKLIDKNDYSGALDSLEKLMNQSGSRVYDKAVIQQTYGYLYEAMNRPAKAIEVFNASLNAKALPIAAAQRVRINLASLYFVSGETKKALDMFEKWYELQTKPSAEALVFGGSLYAANDDYNKAVFYINRAISLTSSPKESWYRRVAAIYIKMEDFTNASRVLLVLIEKYPTNISYWKQLSASYYFSGDEKKSLSVMILANEKKLLKTEKEVIELARLVASQNIPFQASKILEAGLQNGVISKNKANMELLGNTYIQAQEHDKAIQSFMHAANISKDSEIYMKVANLYSENHQWSKALAVLDEHLPEEPQLKARGLVLKGIALYEAGRMDESRKAFQQVSSQKESEILATSWLEYLRVVSSQ